MDGLGEPAKKDAPMESALNGAEDVQMQDDPATNDLKENQESQPPIDDQVLKTEDAENRAADGRPAESKDESVANVQVDSPAKIGEKVEITEKAELEDKVESAEGSNKEVGSDRTESSGKESSVEATGGVQSAGAGPQSDEANVEANVKANASDPSTERDAPATDEAKPSQETE